VREGYRIALGLGETCHTDRGPSGERSTPARCRTRAWFRQFQPSCDEDRSKTLRCVDGPIGHRHPGRGRADRAPIRQRTPGSGPRRLPTTADGYTHVMFWFILVLLVFGLVFGFIARAAVPGDDNMSLAQTWLLGVGGSLLGGFLGAVLFGFDSDDGVLQAGGLIGSIVGSILLLLVVRLVRRRRTADALR
jgi:uncharacterized membrane protein YeaQ/YmgE (transglycosylase-associated protein family)